MFTTKVAKAAEPRMTRITRIRGNLITEIREIRGLQRAWRCPAITGLVVLGWIAVTTSGCTGVSASSTEPDKSWGRHGISDGRFTKPRAIAIDASDRLYVVDMTAR